MSDYVPQTGDFVTHVGPSMHAPLYICVTRAMITQVNSPTNVNLLREDESGVCRLPAYGQERLGDGIALGWRPAPRVVLP